MVRLVLQGWVAHLDLFAQQLQPERASGGPGVKMMGHKWQGENGGRGTQEMMQMKKNPRGKDGDSQRWRSRLMWWSESRLSVFEFVHRCLMLDLPPHRRNYLTVSDSLPLHPVPVHFPACKCSCAAAAILNYIGQWEIVCMLPFFWLV